ncbi:MAG: 5'-methylthioadenosine/adenosylhomocysteine nucleosidase [Clostridia bacterium]|nr:5'-methylthioadenosine/adenosylhomocysteine nucleosidase [Clostridia bacterium]
MKEVKNNLIGVIVAMQEEVEELRRSMQNRTEQKIGFADFYKGILNGVNCVVSCCGEGKVNAAFAAQSMILKYNPDAIINIGVAGGLRDELKVLDVVIATDAVQHDNDTTALGNKRGYIYRLDKVNLKCDEDLTNLLVKSAKESNVNYVCATIATGEQFIDTAEKKRALAKDFNAAACDMEGGAIAHVCALMNVPYAAYRSISDSVEGTEEEYLRKMKQASDDSANIFKNFLKNYKKAYNL